jgi:predicted ATP-dependent Lon-type protease
MACRCNRMPLVTGRVTIKISVLLVRALSEVLHTVRDNGGPPVLLSTDNKRQWANLPAAVIEKGDSTFYSDPVATAINALRPT